MSIYHITDITPVGAYMKAMKASHERSRLDTAHNINIYKGPGIRNYVGRIIGKLLAAAVNQMPRKQIKSTSAE